MMLVLNLFDAPNGNLLYRQGVRRLSALNFSTGRNGYLSLTAQLPLTLARAFALYDAPNVPHVLVTDNGATVWEGRGEDLSPSDGGLQLTALGYYSAFSDVLLNASYRGAGATAQSVVQAIITAVNAVNSIVSADTGLVQSNGLTVFEEFRDEYPVSTLERLAEQGDTSGNLWEVGVWDERRLHFRQRGLYAQTWYVDAVEFNAQRSLSNVWNSVQTLYYTDAGETVRGTAVTNAASIARFNLTRQRIQRGVTQTGGAQAAATQDAMLNYYKQGAPRGNITFTRVYSVLGTRVPLYWVRSGDTIKTRNILPTLSADIETVSSFRSGETEYDAPTNALTVTPEILPPPDAPQLKHVDARGESQFETVMGLDTITLSDGTMLYNSDNELIFVSVDH